MSEISNVNIQELYELDNLGKRVVQKGNVGSTYIYALQILGDGGGKAANVYRAKPNNGSVNYSGSACLVLNGYNTLSKNKKQAAGGHTQTWEYAGSNAKNNADSGWFIGTKPKKNDSYYWDTQIARVKFENKSWDYNTQLPRISNLNQAGRKYGLGYSGTKLVRSEAAVSEYISGDSENSYKYFLIVTVDDSGTGYFSLYNLNDINQALNTNGTSDVNLKTNSVAEKCLKAFKIDNLTSKVGSLQGFDIDSNENIYISSESHPNKTGSIISKPRKIVKIPWNTTETSQWDFIRLDNYTILDESGYATEFEGIQVNSENDLYLTVAYHNKDGYKTDLNKIFRISWKS